MRGPLTILLAVPVLVFGIGMLILWSIQGRWIYPAPDKPPAVMQEGWRLENVQQPQSGQRLAAYYRKAEEGKPTIVYFHGNAGSCDTSVWATEEYAEAGWGVFIPEYPGYGGNPGTPSEKTISDTAKGAMAWARQNGIRTDDIVIVGNSIGSGPAITAAREGASALVIISGLTSLKDVVNDNLSYAPTFLITDRYDNLSDISKVRAPMLIVHGDRDQLIPYRQGQELAKQSGGELITVKNGNHAVAYQGDVQQQIIDWVDSQISK